MTTPADEAFKRPGDGAADAVTVSFADPERGLYGLARLGVAAGDVAAGEDAGLAGSALAVLFRGREPLGATAAGALAVPDAPDWTDLAAGGLRHVTHAPLERWSMAWEGESTGFALELEAISAPAGVDADSPLVAAGGMAGYDQLVRVSGTVRTGDETLVVDGLGQRGHAWGVAGWDGLQLVRTLSAWFGEDRGGILLQSLRPDGAEHDAEAVAATLVERGEPIDVLDPRLSTTYDGDGHQRRAGLELWIDEESGPVRAAGEVICGSSIELGSLRLDLAFMRWHADGVTGVGRYDILRRV